MFQFRTAYHTQKATLLAGVLPGVVAHLKTGSWRTGSRIYSPKSYPNTLYGVA